MRINNLVFKNNVYKVTFILKQLVIFKVLLKTDHDISCCRIWQPFYELLVGGLQWTWCTIVRWAITLEEQEWGYSMPISTDWIVWKPIFENFVFKFDFAVSDFSLPVYLKRTCRLPRTPTKNGCNYL